jgi:hypothetical protein
MDEAKKKKWKNLFLIFVLFLGIILTILEIKLYRKTIIDWKLPTLIWFSGTILTPFLGKLYRYSGIPDSGILGFFFQAFYNIISFGGIAVYIFMAINYYSPEKNLKHYTFPILETSSMKGSEDSDDERQPLVRINYFGQEKTLVFSSRYIEKVEGASEAIITVKPGGLGYDVITDSDVR